MKQPNRPKPLDVQNISPSMRRWLALWAVILLLLSVKAVSAAPAGATAPVIQSTLGDREELEKFIDNKMRGQLQEYHIAGAVVVIVQGDQVLLSKGYGYADIKNQIPVDAEQTLFRPMSISKLLTWTAIMQLVEQGKIDLTADVNTYLTDFQIPPKYNRPITMLDLMSHTPGFDQVFDTMYKGTPEELSSLGTYLAGHIPARIYPPGQTPAYSNYGVMLAGYIVEQVSGEPYDQYIEAHIFNPLGMQHSTMRQVLPEQLANGLSQSYDWFSGAYTNIPYRYCQYSPAGGLSASGADMGRFMLAHLNEGQYNGARILKPETVHLMQTQSYTFDPALPGSAHGFIESTINGRKLIGHDGDIYGWRSMLRMIPTEKVGIFMSINTEDGADTRANLLEAFMNHYFPGTPTEAQQPPADFASRVNRYTGEYFRSDFIYTRSPSKAFQSAVDVKPGRGNTLKIDNPFSSGSDYWVEVQPLMVQNTQTGDLAVFREDEHGQIVSMAISSNPSFIFIRMPWYGTWMVKNGVIVFTFLIFLSVLIGGLVSLIRALRRRNTDKGTLWSSGRLARWTALALSVVGIIFLVAMPLQENTPLDLTNVLLIAPWPIAALALPVVVLAAIAWWKRWWKPAGRIHYTIIALAALALLWFEIYWGFLYL